MSQKIIGNMSKSERDEYSLRKMHEMRIKNELLQRRYQEVQEDRVKAESCNSSVTTKLNKTLDEDRWKSARSTSTVSSYNEWKAERVQIDQERMDRTKDRREWDKGKDRNSYYQDEDFSKRKYYHQRKNYSKDDRQMLSESNTKVKELQPMSYKESKYGYHNINDNSLNRKSLHPHDPEFKCGSWSNEGKKDWSKEDRGNRFKEGRGSMSKGGRGNWVKDSGDGVREDQRYWSKDNRGDWINKDRRNWHREDRGDWLSETQSNRAKRDVNWTKKDSGNWFRGENGNLSEENRRNWRRESKKEGYADGQGERSKQNKVSRVVVVEKSQPLDDQSPWSEVDQGDWCELDKKNVAIVEVANDNMSKVNQGDWSELDQRVDASIIGVENIMKKVNGSDVSSAHYTDFSHVKPNVECPDNSLNNKEVNNDQLYETQNQVLLKKNEFTSRVVISNQNIADKAGKKGFFFEKSVKKQITCDEKQNTKKSWKSSISVPKFSKEGCTRNVRNALEEKPIRSCFHMHKKQDDDDNWDAVMSGNRKVETWLKGVKAGVSSHLSEGNLEYSYTINVTNDVNKMNGLVDYEEVREDEVDNAFVIFAEQHLRPSKNFSKSDHNIAKINLKTLDTVVMANTSKNLCFVAKSEDSKQKYKLKKKIKRLPCSSQKKLSSHINAKYMSFNNKPLKNLQNKIDTSIRVKNVSSKKYAFLSQNKTKSLGSYKGSNLQKKDQLFACKEAKSLSPSEKNLHQGEIVSEEVSLNSSGKSSWTDDTDEEETDYVKNELGKNDCSSSKSESYLSSHELYMHSENEHLHASHGSISQISVGLEMNKDSLPNEEPPSGHIYDSDTIENAPNVHEKNKN